MRKHYFALFTVLLVSGVLLTAFGLYLKTDLPAEYDIYRGENPIALPFVLFADGKLLDALDVEESSSTTVSGIYPEVQPETTQPSRETKPLERTQITMELPPSGKAEIPETTAETAPPTEPEPTYPVYGEDESYFDDALFIGDSRLCGLRDYARLGDADYFCDVGMTVFNVWDRLACDADFSSTDLASLLETRHYGKVYITLGINECGYPMDSFKSEYRNMIAAIRAAQPDAVIVLQSIMAVSRGYAASAGYFEPERLAVLNEFIASLADGERLFYIDVNEIVTGEDGYLRQELSWDGCHLYAKENALWASWLCSCTPQV